MHNSHLIGSGAFVACGVAIRALRARPRDSRYRRLLPRDKENDHQSTFTEGSA